VSFLAQIRRQCGFDDWSISSDEFWVRVSPAGVITPAQGWKLHVCAAVEEAEIVLERCLSVLGTGVAKFKVAATPEMLRELNLGLVGEAQRGKFVTVYPPKEHEAVEIAEALDAVLKGLHGFRVPSDRRLSNDSLVSYRYGAFFPREMQLPNGEIVNAMETPDGKLVPDVRGNRFAPPAWARDPFVAAGKAVGRPKPSFAFNARYMPIDVLKKGYRCSVYAGIDLETQAPCVLKHAHHDAAISPSENPVDRLRGEAEVLRQLDSMPGTPRCLDLVEDRGDLILVLDYVDGRPLDTVVLEYAVTGTFLAPARQLAIAHEIVGFALGLHERGIVHGDLKPANILVDEDLEFLAVLDFESATLFGDAEASSRSSLGTRGYVRLHDTTDPPDPRDDFHAIGAIFYFLLTGSDPYDAPDPTNLLGRPPELMNPNAPAALLTLLRSCLSETDADTVRALLAMWHATGTIDAPAALPAETAAALEGTWIADRSGLGGTLVNLLVDAHLRCRGRDAPYWINGTAARDPRVPRDVSDGVAGIVLALAYVRQDYQSPDLDMTLSELAHWLAASPVFEGGPLPGLYVGEAGVALALGRAAVALEDGALFERARELSANVASLPCSSPDLFHGTAGRARFHLAAHRCFDDPRHLAAASRSAEALLRSATRLPRDECCWTLPAEGHGSRNGRALLGYAHGAAGIADVLLDLADALSDARCLDAAAAAARWICSSAMLSLPDGRGRDWADMPFGRRMGPMWCHGAGGIARFLTRIAEIDLVEDADAMLAGAAESVRHGGRWAGPGQCHGLAGQGEVMLDMFRSTRDTQYLESAEMLARIVGAHLVVPSDRLYPFNPTAMPWTLMNGLSGVATFIARLASSGERAHLLSLEGLGATPAAPCPAKPPCIDSVPALTARAIAPLANQAAAGFPIPVALQGQLGTLITEPAVARLVQAAQDREPTRIVEAVKQSLAAFSEDDLNDNPRLRDVSRLRPLRILALARAFGRAMRRARSSSGSIPRDLQTLFDGKPIPRDALASLMGSTFVSRMQRHGLLEDERSALRLICPMILAGDCLAVVPSAQVAYLGSDSTVLLDVAMRIAPEGGRVAELASGTGFAALMLASRYASVVATDISEVCVFIAKVNFYLNEIYPGQKIELNVADIADGISEASCDLVLANAPWVPTAKSRGKVFADGGPTGSELPRRFIRGGVRLLRPGGVLAMLVTDSTLRDGRRPILEVAQDLHDRGYAVFLFPVLDSEQAKLGEGDPQIERAIEDISVSVLIVWRPAKDNATTTAAAFTAAVNAQAYRFSNGLTVALVPEVAAHETERHRDAHPGTSTRPERAGVSGEGQRPPS
jgi:serine/threonine protein kinase/methylase of polypeptide subunit release factors